MRGKRLVILSLATLIIIIVLMGIAAVFSGLGPRGIRDPHFLSADEKADALRIALNTDDARDTLAMEPTYTTQYQWVVIYRDVLSRSLRGYDYEDLAKAVAEMPRGARLYVEVQLTFGDPPKIRLDIAVNPETGAVANVMGHPLKGIPTTTVPVPSG